MRSCSATRYYYHYESCYGCCHELADDFSTANSEFYESNDGVLQVHANFCHLLLVEIATR